jgi:hypothetical protein
MVTDDVEVQYNRISTTFSMPLRTAEGMSVDEFIRSAARIGSQLGSERAKQFFKTFPTPSPHAVSFEWEGLVEFQQILDLWEKMEIEFDAKGMPIWPQVVLNSRGFAEFKEKFPKWEQDPECRTKWDDLVKRKRKEFGEREARRRLVD